jgi:hypothetical protein
MLNIFRDIPKLRLPSEHPLENFCSSVFDGLREDPDAIVHVTRVEHYKETSTYTFEIYPRLF